jgi:hypothetical protein
MRIAVSMVRTSSELLCGGERWLTDFVVLGLAALLLSDAAVFEGLGTPSRIEAALLFSCAALSDGSVTPSSTDRLCGGDLREFFFSTVKEESRVWVISGLGSPPPLRCFRWQGC